MIGLKIKPWHLLGQSNAKFKPNCDIVTSISPSLMLGFFASSTYWLIVLFSFVLNSFVFDDYVFFGFGL